MWGYFRVIMEKWNWEKLILVQKTLKLCIVYSTCWPWTFWKLFCVYNVDWLIPGKVHPSAQSTLMCCDHLKFNNFEIMEYIVTKLVTCYAQRSLKIDSFAHWILISFGWHFHVSSSLSFRLFSASLSPSGLASAEKWNHMVPVLLCLAWNEKFQEMFLFLGMRN